VRREELRKKEGKKREKGEKCVCSEKKGVGGEEKKRGGEKKGIASPFFSLSPFPPFFRQDRKRKSGQIKETIKGGEKKRGKAFPFPLLGKRWEGPIGLEGGKGTFNLDLSKGVEKKLGGGKKRGGGGVFTLKRFGGKKRIYARFNKQVSIKGKGKKKKGKKKKG